MALQMSELWEKIYMLDCIQEGAKPHIEMNEKEKTITVTELWISNHYEDEEDIPSAFSVASEILSLIKEEYPDFTVVLEIYDINGRKNTFNSKEI